MRLVPLHQAIGLDLCHDLTQVIPASYKGPAFKKGHVIRSEDIPLLLDMGKEHIYVMEHHTMVHEDEAAQRLARAAAGEGLFLSTVAEGKVSLLASRPGLLKVNHEALFRINSIDQIIFSTLHNNQWVPQGKTTAATRVIPLLVEAEKVRRAEELCALSYPLISVKPIKPMNISIVITGNEVCHGRIKDGFGPVLTHKIQAMGSRVSKQIMVGDDQAMIAQALTALLDEGAEMILVTGGMSVDPDDRTLDGVKAAGAQILAYGVPVLPGYMLMIALLGEIPVLGLPACVLHAPVTVFDLLLPRLLAGEIPAPKDLIELGHGGLCSGCAECRFPACSFGK